MNKARARFKNILHDQNPLETPSDGPPVIRMSIRREFEGDMDGVSTAELLVCQLAQDKFSYVGLDRFTGRLGGRSGSLVFQHGGTHEGGGHAPVGFIVPGSGTQEMRGLVGDLKIFVDPEGHVIELDYEFEL